MKLNNMTTYIALTLVTLFILVVLWKYFDSRNWIEISGVIKSIQIEEHYNRPESSMSSGKSFTEYKINLVYQYSVNNDSYTGTQIYTLIPNVFSDKKDAEDMLQRFPENQNTTVFYNPNNHKESCLITSKGVSGFLLSLYLIIIVAIVIGMFWFISKVFKDF